MDEQTMRNQLNSEAEAIMNKVLDYEKVQPLLDDKVFSLMMDDFEKASWEKNIFFFHFKSSNMFESSNFSSHRLIFMIYFGLPTLMKPREIILYQEKPKEEIMAYGKTRGYA